MDNSVSLGRAGEPLVFVSQRELAERHHDHSEKEAEASESLKRLDEEFVSRARSLSVQPEQIIRSPSPPLKPPSIPKPAAPEPRAPSNLSEVLGSDLSALCSDEVGWTWRDMADSGVCAEDLLFNPVWRDELKAPVLSRLGVKWRDLANAGLTADMVAAARKPMDWWVLNLGADDMFFHTLGFRHGHLERLEWEPTSFRALLGCDVWIGEGGFVELRPTNIKPLII